MEGEVTHGTQGCLAVGWNRRAGCAGVRANRRHRRPVGAARRSPPAAHRDGTRGNDDAAGAAARRALDERLARAERDHDAAKRELEDVSRVLAQMAKQMEELDNAAAQEANPERQRGLAMEQAAVKSESTELAARQLRLRARESELATRFGSEELQWTELNRRLDEIERAISGRTPR
jgi:hypothetical protein